MTIAPELKNAPYGVDTFPNLLNRNFAYVDKTAFIEQLENCGSDKPFIVRPRRFGKSLFTSMLQAYYDKAAAADFEKNFAGTYISRHKTPLAGQFYVVKFNFSGFGSSTDVALSFLNRVRTCIRRFFERYPHPESHRILTADYPGASDLLDDFCSSVYSMTQGQLYVIIDEYDQFTNEILAKDYKQFKALTSCTGFVKDFYTTLKYAYSDGAVARIYMTGVTSISLDSVTSGYSVAKNVSFNPKFASVFGFTTEELRSLIPQLIDLTAYDHSLDEVLKRMRVLYNGYRFSPASDETLFNASMCLYYLDHIRETNEEPDQLLDPSVAEDLSKIHGILRLGSRQDVEAIVSQAIRKEAIPFGSQPEVLNLQTDGRLTRKGLLSTLLYLGYLTYAPGNTKALVVPNRAMAQQFFDVYFHFLRGFPDWEMTTVSRYAPAIAALADGNPKPLVETVAQVLTEGCGLHSSLHLHESDFQSALLIAANLASDYTYAAELEVRGAEPGFIDLLLKSEKGQYSYLFELKYLTKEKGTPEAVARTLSQAVLQARGYSQGDNIRRIPHLKRVAAVFVGTELKAVDVSE